jgi:predicted O-methyltransferase YrrM
VTLAARIADRVRGAREQQPSLRLPFALAPVHRRSGFVLRRRLRAVGAEDPAALLRELDADGVHDHVVAALAEYRALAPDFAAGSLDPVEGALLYGIVRTLQPDVAVETGTASGISTTYLLAALRRNGRGRLVSIDLPFEAGEGPEFHALVAGAELSLWDASPIPPGKQPGWAVPEALRDRWELRLGDALELLPALLREVGEVGFFFHDSLHTRDHMLFEFETAWPHLARGGVLSADDIFQRRHDALPAFARSVGRPYATFSNLGIVVKR